MSAPFLRSADPGSEPLASRDRAARRENGGARPYADLTEEILGLIAEGKIQAIVSTIAVAELLVKPFETADVTRVELCERFLLSLPNSEFVAPDYIIAREAARMRARHHVRIPDAIFLATALVREAVFVSNDRALMRKGTTSGQVWEW